MDHARPERERKTDHAPGLLDELLDRAVELATVSVERGGGPFGAVVARPLGGARCGGSAATGTQSASMAGSGARELPETGSAAAEAVDAVEAAQAVTQAVEAAQARWEIVAEGANRVVLDNDPTAHAEVVALRAAGGALGSFDLSDCVLLASCEPCPMCLTAGLWARVSAMYYAADRRDAAEAGFDDLAFYEAFESPRAQWQVPVRQRLLPGATVPFEAWRDRRTRVAY